jgi:hypothetical protein
VLPTVFKIHLHKIPDRLKALISDLSTGTKNAANALNDGRSSGQLNPSTQVHILVDMLRRIKQ